MDLHRTPQAMFVGISFSLVLLAVAPVGAQENGKQDDTGGLQSSGQGEAAPVNGFRAAEFARLAAVYERAVGKPTTCLAVLLGSPGLGKSRLIDEFAGRCGETATVLTAHCDTAGGGTFAPLLPLSSQPEPWDSVCGSAA